MDDWTTYKVRVNGREREGEGGREGEREKARKGGRRERDVKNSV